MDRSGFIVKQVAALKQIAAAQTPTPPPVTPVTPANPLYPPVSPDEPTYVDPDQPDQPTKPVLREPTNKHFYMTADIDTMRVNRDVSRLMDEVINHLMSVDGSSVAIRLEVQADMPNGAPVPTVRTVTENCRTLHIGDFGFDD